MRDVNSERRRKSLESGVDMTLLRDALRESARDACNDGDIQRIYRIKDLLKAFGFTLRRDRRD